MDKQGELTAYFVGMSEENVILMQNQFLSEHFTFHKTAIALLITEPVTVLKLEYKIRRLEQLRMFQEANHDLLR